MYELLKLIEFADIKVEEKKQLALASIVRTVGSSYRKKGTQMILSDDLEYEGAISGGCVESEVLRQSEKVFQTKKNVIFEYDGQYKLGCNGKIYILIEYLNNSTIKNLSQKIRQYHKDRQPIIMGIRKDRNLAKAATYFSFNSEKIRVSQPDPDFNYDESGELDILPQNQLVIVGGEYDSVSLAQISNSIGFQTFLVVKESFSYKLPSAVRVAYFNPDELSSAIKFDSQTAIVLMTHSLSKDLNYLIEMLKVESKYLGILGPPSRRETILNNLMNYNEGLLITHADKLENLYGPTGLNIGAKTPEEISISILSEIISVFNHQPVSLSMDH